MKFLAIMCSLLTAAGHGTVLCQQRHHTGSFAARTLLLQSSDFRSHTMTKTWVVIADEAIARILTRPAARAALESLEELTDPDSHAGTAALQRDAEQHQHAELFARRVADHLDLALRQHRYTALYLIAAPRFLGLLRKAITPQVADVIVEEVNKDLVHADNADIERRLSATLR
jgi:protein required for attachment to host cells